MSVNVPDAPTYTNPVVVGLQQIGDHYEGKFSPNWLGWLLALNRAVQDLQASIPISAQVFGPAAGTGPFSGSVVLTTRRAAILTVFGTAIQTFTGTAPSWEVQLNVDGVVTNTGVITNSWQTVVNMVFKVSVAPGQHTVSVSWGTNPAGATLQQLSLTIFPAYFE